MNDKIAILAARITATMACVYFFVALALTGAPYGSSSPTTWVQWTSTTFLQLVMLPLLAVGQKRLSERHDDHAEKLDALHKKVDAL